MAEIDITILDLVVRYVLPFLIGYLFIFHLCWGLWKLLISFVQDYLVNCLRNNLHKYWRKIYKYNKAEIEQMFAPLHKLKMRNGGQRLRVMEIGIGEGSNFVFYPPNCDVFCVDPEPVFEQALRENIAKFDSLDLKMYTAAGAEDMSHIDDNSMDAVVCTLVLCSVKKPQKVVEEVKRILRKGGVFLFWEHVYATGKFPLSTLQWAVTKFFWFVPGSCNLTRETWKVIEEANFSKHEYVKRRMAVMSLDGVFIFWEHVYASNDTWIAKKQWFLNEFWGLLFGGCHLIRKSWEYIEAAHFSTHEFSTISLPVMSIVSTTVFGSATK